MHLCYSLEKGTDYLHQTYISLSLCSFPFALCFIHIHSHVALYSFKLTASYIVCHTVLETKVHGFASHFIYLCVIGIG